MGQLSSIGVLAVLFSLTVSFMSISKLGSENMTTNKVATPRGQDNPNIDVYPQIPVALDPYDHVPTRVRESWGNDCKGKCGGADCATTPHAIRHHTLLTEVLAEWVRISTQEHFTTLLNYGSLIASRFRNATQSQWDTDMDASIWAHDAGRLETFAATYNHKQSKFYLAVNPDWRIKYDIVGDYTGANPHGDRTRFIPQNRHEWSFEQPSARLYHTEMLCYIDLQPMYVPNQGAEEGAVAADSSPEIELDADTKYLTVPRDWIFPLQRCYLNGIKTTCPAKGGALTGLFYGGDKNKPPKDPDHVLDWATGCWKKMVTRRVLCGGHYAISCAECPLGNGKSWCNADCVWCNDQCVSKSDAGADCIYNP